MQIIIDRIEGDVAIVEFPDMTTKDVPLCLFPEAKEGDSYIISKNEGETADRHNRIQDKFNRLKSIENN